MSQMKSVSEVKALIESGKWLALAGDESLLSQLPKGNWIGGTIPYFMTEKGGLQSKDKIFVNVLEGLCEDSNICSYNVATMPRIVADGPENGYSLIIIPAGSESHSIYAKQAPNYSGLFLRPIIGWIAGVDLADLGRKKPKVFNGLTGRALESEAVVLHAVLPQDKLVTIDIINLFTQGDGDSIVFEEDGFTVKTALINGNRTSLAKYIADKEIDTKLPLVADYNGAMVNLAIQSVDQEVDEVSFYAPVFTGLEYKIAKPVENYVEEFEALVKDTDTDVVFSCNCILNYLYSSLEGKKTGHFTGPITFGEIAYQLLNQTLTYMIISDR
ncbi:MAG: hypothetical protein P8X63_04320 [Desulfuromonadaceae bacterium]